MRQAGHSPAFCVFGTGFAAAGCSAASMITVEAKRRGGRLYPRSVGMDECQTRLKPEMATRWADNKNVSKNAQKRECHKIIACCHASPSLSHVERRAVIHIRLLCTSPTMIATTKTKHWWHQAHDTEVEPSSKQCLVSVKANTVKAATLSRHHRAARHIRTTLDVLCHATFATDTARQALRN